MLKEFIEKIVNLAPVEQFNIGGRDFSSKPLTMISRPQIEPIETHTLQSVVDYFQGTVGVQTDISCEESLIHIINPYQVAIVSGSACPDYQTRECFLIAKRIHREFEFNTYLEQERMTIALMTLFEQTETTKEIISVVSGLVIKDEVQINDDGVSQDATYKTGASRISTAKIENPIKLKPIRTFVEAGQVESPYVLRIRKGRDGLPEVAIFEAGGEQWKNEAIQNIKKWLEPQLPDVKILS